jgi:hypothetical protein
MNNLQVWVHRAEHAALFLALLIAGVFAHLHYKDVAVRDAQKLAQQGLPPDALAKYVVQQNQLIELIRNAQGKTTVQAQYVPDEGGVQILVKKQTELEAKYQALLAELHSTRSSATIAAIDAQISSVTAQLGDNLPQVTVQDRGFTSRFGFGMVVSPGHVIHYRTSSSGGSLDLPVSPEFDWKYGYWQRYSALVQVNLFYPGLEFTRHVDDVTPRWLHLNNTEVGLSGGPGWTGGWSGGLVLRTNW